MTQKDQDPIFVLDAGWSTTRVLSNFQPEIENPAQSKVQTRMFLPEGEGRQGEGGLRKKGYFKHSYEVVDGKWYITDNFSLKDDWPKVPVDFEIPADVQDLVQANLFHKDQGGSQTQDVELKKSADSALANAKSKSILGGLARPSSFYNGFFEVENDDIDGENAYCWNFNAV